MELVLILFVILTFMVGAIIFWGVFLALCHLLLGPLVDWIHKREKGK